MFEGDLCELDTRALLSAGAEFRAIEDRAAARQLEVALVFADRCPDPRADADYGAGFEEPSAGGERGRVYGGVGCPAVAEFAAAELAAVFGWSTGVGEAFMGEAQALRYRLPRIWAMVLAGEAVPWRARQVARFCLALSQDAAAIVDERVAGIINSVGWSRLKTIVKAAVLEADPDGAKAAAERAARERGVFVGESDEHGTKTVWVKAAAGDVIRFDATVDDLARALRTLGDTDSLDLRRAKAIGWIADPASAHRLLEAARLLATTRSAEAADTTNDASTAGASPDSASPDGARTDGASTAGASAQGARTDGASTAGASADGASSAGARTGGAGSAGARTGDAGADSTSAGGGSAEGARTEGPATSTDRAGRDSAANRGGGGAQDRGRRDTGAGAAAARTDPAAPHQTHPCPADEADTAEGGDTGHSAGADAVDANAAATATTADPAGPGEQTGLAAETCAAQPCPTTPCASQPGPSGAQDRESGESGESGESDNGDAGGAAARAGDLAGDLAADLPADLLADLAGDVADWVPVEEPGPDDEADRDTPHPCGSDHLDYLDTLDTADLLKAMAILAWRVGPRHNEPDTDAPDTGAGPGASADPDTGAGPGTGVGRSASADPDAGASGASADPGAGARLDTGAGPGAGAGLGADADAETGAAAGASAGAGARTGAEAAGAGAGAPDPFSRQALAGKLAAIRQAAYKHGLATNTTTGAGAGAGGGGRGRGGSVLYLHLADQTLATGEGIVRVEGAGPFLVGQLAELVGHGQIVVKPVIDLNEGVSVDSYEIPRRIRERVKLMDPVDQFPYGTAETTFSTDLDHIEPYDTAGPPGQTSTENLAPESRFHHRLKTHGGWRLRRLPGRTREWTSPHGFMWRRDRTGTHRIDNQPSEEPSEDDDNSA